MSDTNLSAVLYKKGDLRLEDRGIPEPGPGEVQISMQKVGICGSDVKYWTAGAIGDFIVKGPILLGHEASGIVTKLGPNVKNLKVGDRVAMDPHITCRSCEFCKAGRYNMCPDLFFLATPPDSGALARFHVHAADFVFKLPDNVSFEEGACVEPLSVGLNACRRVGVTMGNHVLITGAGPIGLCSLLVAKAYGAAAICITDIDAKRLEFAKSLGASHTYLIDKDDKPEELGHKIGQLMGGPPHQTIECSGAQFSVDLAIYATRHAGAVGIIGHGPPRVSFPIVTTVAKELDIKGCFRYVNTWPTLIEMISAGQINVKPIITHNFTIEETLQAFETAKSGAGIKVMIDCAKKMA
ncbi:L-iditol 2-dehydrogenase [Mytilus galloprovincialis]|uniref:Sorbitol dehydrogenase n=1 Tax=Mytilus galloprovincialis TaxID=29158 RepID=A0A8B6GEZ2_MYTGA|nr:L-iditol 2-dehydrogenase [Mytilus galloprovincialis]